MRILKLIRKKVAFLAVSFQDLVVSDQFLVSSTKHSQKKISVTD
jgi:hypothetical protein